MNAQQAIQYIHSLPTFSQTGSLEGFTQLLHALGSPQNSTPCVHIAGTNGKGSVCAYLSEVLAGNGYKVGLFTSPFLTRFNERIMVNNQPISDETLTKYVWQVRDVYEKGNYLITQFAFITAIMFLAFRDNKVDIAVIEAGMGGKNDPTVLCNPLLCVITSIGLDHTKILGQTIEEIAAHKAGIIKQTVPVVVSPNPETVLEVIRSEADYKNSKCCIVSQSEITDISCSLGGGAFTYENERYKINMLGYHQVTNAAVAVKACKLLQEKLNKTLEIKPYLERTVWPGRLEVVMNHPLFILDGCHNPQGAQTAADFIRSVLADKRIILICGMVKDKDTHAIAGILSDIANTVIAVPVPSSRSCSAKETAALFKEFSESVLTAADADEAISTAMAQADQNDVIFACGSLYLVGEIKNIFTIRKHAGK